MKVILILLAGLLGSCTAFEHTARAPRAARHTYHHAQRVNARHRLGPAPIYWN